MSGWSFGFNSKDPLKGAHHPLQQLNSPADNINRHQKEGRIKQPDFDTSASVMKDALLKVNGDARESSEPSFCTKDNLLNCIAYVNQELELIGFPCLKFEDGKCVADLYFFINRLHDILSLYHKTVAVKEDLETKNHRLSCEANHHQSTCERLRRDKNHLDREIGLEQERSRQINLKYKQVSAKLKAEKEEVKRLVAVVQSRDVQHRHDDKKREREIMALKERLHQLLADKVPDRKVGMDLRNVVSSGDGRRATWKTNQAKLGEEIYQQHVISSYEERHKQLMVENEDLRDCLLFLKRQLSGLMKRTGSMGASPANESPSSLSISRLSEGRSVDQPQNSHLSVKELDEGYIQMPFDIVRQEIERIFKETYDHISTAMKQSGIAGETKRDFSMTSTAVESNFLGRSETERRDSSGGAQELERLKKQLSNYKEIIQQQEELIQQSLQSQSQSVETSFLHESQLLKEKENLSDQKKLFFEEKSAFEKERRAFMEAAKHLAKERQALQEERARTLRQHLQNSSPVREKQQAKAKGDAVQPSRQLPATPVVPPAKGSDSSGPSTPTRLPAMQEVHHTQGLSPDSVVTHSTESSNREALLLQSGPVIHFTPSTRAKQTPSISQPAPLSSSSSPLGATATSPSHASDHKSNGSSDDTVALASIRAARVRIKKSASQQGP